MNLRLLRIAHGRNAHRRHARRTARPGRRAGNIIVLAAAGALVVCLFIGLVIETGFVYGKKAQLSKAVDAAALAGIGNLYQGHGNAAAVARNVFTANYWDPANPGQNAQAPDLDVQFLIGPENNIVVQADAKAYLRPVFINLLGTNQTFTVAATASAERARLLLSLVLDRSGSMQGNQGWSMLPPAVDTFVDFFEDGSDRMSLTTYASAARVDVTMRRPFKQDVIAAVPRDFFEYGGFTFIDGGLELARRQNEFVLPPNESAMKVVVLFTDGFANTFQDDFLCPPSRSLNLSGSDSGNAVFAMDPANGNQLCLIGARGAVFPCCPGLRTFRSIVSGQDLDATNAALVRQEGKDRALHRARQMRQEGNLIYTVGLGNDPAMHDFLRDVANDPDAPHFDQHEPQGLFVAAPTASDLQAAFARIARQILIRLSA